MIAAIELAMLERLRVTAPALGFAWKTLATFPTNWEAYLESTAVITCPAAWVVFAGWTAAERDTDDQLVLDGSFFLIVADENMRPSEEYQRHGGGDIAKEPGSLRLMLAAVVNLAGQSLGLDLVSPLECGPAQPIAPTAASARRRMSRYAVEFTCRFPLVLVGDGETDPAELETLHANWDVPPFGDPVPVDSDPVAPGAQLPDDPHADATDTLQLRTD